MNSKPRSYTQEEFDALGPKEIAEILDHFCHKYGSDAPHYHWHLLELSEQWTEAQFKEAKDIAEEYMDRFIIR